MSTRLAPFSIRPGAGKPVEGDASLLGFAVLERSKTIPNLSQQAQGDGHKNGRDASPER